MKYILSIMFLTITCCSVSAGDLIPFKSDGCSSFPDGTISQGNLWQKCCIEHDKAYWVGGTKEQRKNADEELRSCVAKVGEPEIAQLMLAGVRVGGTPYLPTSFRWGYGWPFPRGYTSPTKEEQTEIDKEIKKFITRK